MNKVFNILLLVIAFAFTACDKEHDNYFTEAQIVLLMPEGINPQQLQGTLTAQNLNSMLTTSTSEITTEGFRISLLRGAYKLDVEGMIRFTTTDGATLLRHFRAHSDYVSLSDEPVAKAELNITLLQE